MKAVSGRREPRDGRSRRIILQSLEDNNWDLFVTAIETTDRISHMMWRLTEAGHPMYDAALAAQYGDAIERIYRRADAFVGTLRARVPPDALFIVMSDHGFHSFRRGVNLNTWLLQAGYMAVGDDKGSMEFFKWVDWTKTRAYAVGLGQIYVNLQGRERDGRAWASRPAGGTGASSWPARREFGQPVI